MPYRFESEGVTELMKQCKGLEDKADFIASQALFEGAAVMAAEINKQVRSIKTRKAAT